MKNIAKKGDEKGVIIFIHGNSSSAEIFSRILESEKLKQTKIAVRLPGHKGNMEGFENENDFSIDSYVDKISEFINSIDDDILLVGNSLGGHISIEMAHKILRLKGLMIMGTPPLKKPLNIEEAFVVTPALQVFMTEKPLETEIKNASKIAVFNEEHAPFVENSFKESNPKVRTEMTIDLTENKFSNQYKTFTELLVPKFIVHGENDPSVNLDYLKTLQELSSTNCELTIINNCGHYPSIETPEQFIEILSKASNKVFN